MLWGRLNASESIIRALVPEEHPQFEALIEEAQRAIVDDFVRDLDSPPDMPEGSWAWFLETYDPPKKPPEGPTLTVLDRAAVVLGKVVGDAVPAKVAPGWGLLASVLRPNPGGIRAVAHILRAVVLGTLPGLVGLVAWLALVGAGIGLVVSDASVPLGVALLVLAALLAGALVIGLWLAISRLRAAIAKRVGMFVFGPP